jgi:hypothetical protein
MPTVFTHFLFALLCFADKEELKILRTTTGLHVGNHTSQVVDGKIYDMGYYLVDGIYPQYATFAKMIPKPQALDHQVNKTFKV